MLPTIFCSISKGSLSPIREAVSGINCMRPIAPPEGYGLGVEVRFLAYVVMYQLVVDVRAMSVPVDEIVNSGPAGCCRVRRRTSRVFPIAVSVFRCIEGLLWPECEVQATYYENDGLTHGVFSLRRMVRCGSCRESGATCIVTMVFDFSIEFWSWLLYRSRFPPGSLCVMVSGMETRPAKEL